MRTVRGVHWGYAAKGHIRPYIRVLDIYTLGLLSRTLTRLNDEFLCEIEQTCGLDGLEIDFDGFLEIGTFSGGAIVG